MPMTVAHPMAVLPLLRTRLDWTCLVIGSMAPDFEYFLRVRRASSIGHSPLGVVVFCLPVTLISALLFHRTIKQPAVRIAPSWLRGRLAALSGRPWMPRWSAAALTLLVVSSLLGAATHVLWDSATHADRWGPLHIAALRAPVDVPVLGTMVVHRILQHASTLCGLVVLAIFTTRALRKVVPVATPAASRAERLVWLGSVVFVGVLAMLRIWLARSADVGDAVVAIIDAALGGSVVATLICRRVFVARSVEQ
jgi:hypothetical protein